MKRNRPVFYRGKVFKLCFCAVSLIRFIITAKILCVNLIIIFVLQCNYGKWDKIVCHIQSRDYKTKSLEP